jgi:hypothetical protein
MPVSGGLCVPARLCTPQLSQCAQAMHKQCFPFSQSLEVAVGPRSSSAAGTHVVVLFVEVSQAVGLAS